MGYPTPPGFVVVVKAGEVVVKSLSPVVIDVRDRTQHTEVHCRVIVLFDYSLNI